MAIELTEKMTVDVPIEAAWRFISDAGRVAPCLPGAELIEQVDDNTYLGKAKVKLGAITTAYKGEVVFDHIDKASHTMHLTGQGRETGGGTARGTLEVKLVSQPDGRVEMNFDIRVDLTGRVMQMGRGMIKGVSAQLFKQFAENSRAVLEAEAAGRTDAAASSEIENAPLEVGALLGRTLWQMLVNFFKRLFGRKSA